MKKKNKVRLFRHQILVTGIAVFALIVSVFGTSYALFTSNVSSNEYNVLKVGSLEMSYVDTGSGYGDILSLNGAYPMADRDGLSTEPYRFYIKNTGTIASDFKIKLKQDESIIEMDGCGDNLLPFEYVKVQFDSTGEVYKLSDLVSSDYTLYSKDNLAVGSSEIHEIRIWIDANAPNSVLGKHFHGKLVIESTQAGIDDRYAKQYAVGESVTLIDGSKWHVLENANSESTTVTLLSDYNLNSDAVYCTNDTCDTIAFDSNNISQYQKNGSTAVNDSTIKTWLETNYLPKLETAITTANGTVDDLVVTLPTMYQIANANSKDFDQSIVSFDSNSFVVTSTYWTKTPYDQNTYSVWYVKQSTTKNDLINANDSTKVGVRPVITVSKLNVIN